MKYNLFSFAPRELSHSAFWAWVLQAVDSDSPELEGPRRVARRLLQHLKANDLVPPVTVRTEVKLPGKAGRLDILLKDSGGTVVAIENKVLATPSRRQLERYERALEAMRSEKFFRAIISTAFDEDVRGSLLWPYLGVDELLTILTPDKHTSQILKEYTEWLEALREERLTLQRGALGTDPQAINRSLRRREGQWAAMRHLSEGMTGSQQRDLNLDGTPWTTFEFATDRQAPDTLYYRIGSFKAGPVLSVCQYQPKPRPSLAEKKERLQMLRAWWREAYEPYAETLPARKPSGRGANQSEIARFLLTENPPVKLQSILSVVHSAFVKRLKAEGWAVRS